MLTPKNARGRPVTKLCLALETWRRTDEGRVRDAKAFLGHWFPQERGISIDRLFVHIPKEVRADLLSNWGIRGKKSALRDDDEKVRTTVHDALAAGDIDASVIEDGITPEILVDWAPLADWWTFWRAKVLPVTAARKALAAARALDLFDERWFFDHLALPTQKIDGTDVVCAALSKEQVAAWLASVHASGDASPAGLVNAVGWDVILAKTAHEALLFALDALAAHIGIAVAPPDKNADEPAAAPPGPGKRPDLPTPEAPSEPTLVQSRTHAEPATRSSAAISVDAPATVVAIKPPSVAVPVAAATSASAPPSTKPGSKPEISVPAQSVATTGRPVDARPAESRPADTKPEAHTPPAASAQGAAPAPPKASKTPAKPPPLPGTKTPSLPIAPAVEEPPPTSGPPTARALFGAPEPAPSAPPMRPKAPTLVGVGPDASASPTFAETAVVDLPPRSYDAPLEDPAWAPPRAEPGDMGWDLVYGVKRTMGPNVQPKYNFDDDDEPTSEIALPGDPRRP